MAELKTDRVPLRRLMQELNKGLGVPSAETLVMYLAVRDEYREKKNIKDDKELYGEGNFNLILAETEQRIKNDYANSKKEAQ